MVKQYPKLQQLCKRSSSQNIAVSRKLAKKSLGLLLDTLACSKFKELKRSEDPNNVTVEYDLKEPFKMVPRRGQLSNCDISYRTIIKVLVKLKKVAIIKF